jgi:protein disulfide-isomerase A1
MNKFICLALVVLAVSAHDWTLDEGVVVLTDSNFDHALEEFDFALVEFYAPWCGHCKKLAPEFAAAAQQLASSAPNVKLCKVDATVEKEASGKFDIKGFPTLKWFIRGSSHPVDYEGGRTAPEIVQWISKTTGPVSVEVKSVEEVEKYKSDHEVVGVFFGNPESHGWKDYSSVAAAHDDIIFIHVADDSVKSHFGAKGGFVLFKKFDEGRNDFESAWTHGAFSHFINSNKFPTVLPFDQKAAQRIFGEGHNALFVIVGDNEAGLAAEKEFEIAAKELQGKITFSRARLHEQMGQRLADYIGVTEKDVPTLRIVLPSQNMHKFNFEGEVTAKNVKAFYEDWANGRLKPFFKSEPIPESNDEPVKVIVGKNFQDVVINSNDDVLMEFYAPWCGHCKQLTPIYDSLATRLKNVKGLVIAKMDATANEVEGVEIKGFPTIKFFAKGRKHNPMDFEGDRTEEGFVEFLKKHSSANFDGAHENHGGEL